MPESEVIDVTALLASWPSPREAAIALVDRGGVRARGGAGGRVSRIASISKVVAALATLVAVEEGTVGLDDPAGPEGATVRHLLAHASGLNFDSRDVVAGVGRRRIYSNAGIEVLAEHVTDVAGIPFADYQREAVIEPLAMRSTELVGSPAHGLRSCADDLVLLTQELLEPTIIAAATLAEATSVQFPGLAGVLPGIGRFDPLPWGLGVEIRGDKVPHWTPPECSPRTFGHFGGSGTFLWVDPDAGLASVALSGTDFGPWALEAWPRTGSRLRSLVEGGPDDR